MDFKPLIQWLQRQITTGFFWTKILNSKDISDPIVRAIEGKEYETVNPDSISEPIVDAVSETTQAIKDLEFPRELRVLNLDEVKLDLGEVVSLLQALISKKDKEIVVKQGDVNVDLKPLQKELEKIRKAIPETEKQEVIDYTMTLDSIAKLLEKPGYSLELLQIIERLENIKFPDFKFNKDGELVVEQGKQRIFFDHRNQNADGVYINPMTEETGQEISGKVATEETLQEVKTAIENSNVELKMGSTVLLPPTSFVVTNGALGAGTVDNAKYHDNTYLQINEVAGDGMTVDFTYTLPEVGKTIEAVQFHGRYEGGGTHYQDFYVYDYNLLTWVEVSGATTDLPTGTIDRSLTFELNNPNFVSGTECKVRIKHSIATYNSSHRLYIDYIAVQYQNSLDVSINTDSIVAFDASSDLSTTIVTAGNIKTITETDGVKTLTTVIDSTDPNNKTITSTWA